MSIFTTSLGTWTIDKLFETDVTVTTQFLFPDWGNAPHPGPFALSIYTMVLRNGKQTTLIDTGAGNGKHRPETLFLDHLDTLYLSRLAALAISCECDRVHTGQICGQLPYLPI